MTSASVNDLDRDATQDSRAARTGGAGDGPIGLCLDCGYALHGLPTPRCPECGREFDPLDPKTMNMGRELSELAKWVLGPVRWPVSLMSWGAIVIALWYARLPGGQIAGSSSLWILIGLGVLWMMWPVVRVIAARKYGWPTSLLMRGQRLRLTVGLSILLAAIAIVYQLPMKAALYVSRPAMDRLAQELLQSGEQYADDRWCGVYKATRVKVIANRGDLRGGVRITVEESNRAYRSGFTYLPTADTRKNTRRSYQHVGGGWWAWREEG
ncbi:MAG: hypothetical protein QOF78_163 [Phycisphaerales bacterium]|jgi:hypothetical protein|nr:hypothetical protein [Phycisphaerales bacterium]